MSRRSPFARRRSPLSRPGVVAGITVLAVLVLLLGAWVVDTAVSGDDVRRNVEVAGRDVGGQGPDQLDETLAAVAAEYAGTAVTITTPTGDLATTASAVGLAVDTAATADEVLAVGGGASPLTWLSSLFAEDQVDLSFTVDQAVLDAAVAELVAANATEAVEPTLTLTEGTVTVVPSVVGTRLDTDGLADQLVAAAEAAQLAPVTVDLDVVESPPAHDDAEAQAVAAEANELTDETIVLVVDGRQVALSPQTMRPWVAMTENADGALELTFDEATVTTDVTALIGEVGSPVQQVSWNVAGDGTVSFAEGSPGTACCAPGTGQKVVDALRADAGSVDIELEVVAPDHDAAWAESMQIVEPIASFTTNMAPGQPRVKNIQRIADLTRGVVIEPGGTFSVNDHVGRRTEAKGFVEDGVIYDGKLTKDVGGGVSQYATTLFNAAFFGGLDIPAYQMHTLYISRYPYGREATLSYPSPDLQITNITPYGVLLWPTYTGSSLTVTLYSTPWVEGEQTGQTESSAGPCTRVRTERTRTWLEDGRTETDSFTGLYQPADGVRC